MIDDTRKDRVFAQFASVLGARIETATLLDEGALDVVSSLDSSDSDPVTTVDRPAPYRVVSESDGGDLDQCPTCARRICRCQKGEAPAHAGRRRRRITEDLFRCKLPLVIQGNAIACNALVWRRPDKMREHLCDHLSPEQIDALDDSQLQVHYANAARISQEGIYDDEAESEDDD